MKYLNNLLALMLFFFIVNEAVSQKAPGYMGRRLSVNYSSILLPNVSNVNKNGDKGFTNLNYKHRLSLEYSLNRKRSIGFAFEMYNTGIEYNFEIEQSLNDEGQNSSSYRSLRYYPEGYGKISAKSFSLYKVNYRNGISPLGKHMILGVKVIFASTDLSELTFHGSPYLYDFEGPIPNYEKTKESLKNTEFGFVWGYGVNRIIQDRVLISFGFDFTILPFAFIDYVKSKSDIYNFEDGADQYSSYNSQEELFKTYTAKRLFSHELFNLKIGIGFLAY